MDLRWWWVLIIGVLCVAVGLAVAWFWPMARLQRRLRPLAHVSRLTRLPEYATVYRAYVISTAVAMCLLLVALSAALLAGGRPMGLSSVDRKIETAHPLDIMLCVGQSVTDPTTSDFLDHYAQQADSFDSQRIGLTSASLRVMPMTLDRQYAAQHLRQLGKLAALQQKVDTHQPLSDAESVELTSGIEEFSRSISYVDYAGNVEDTLALCMTGFPSFNDQSHRRRQLIYLGYSDFRGSEENRPALFDDQTVKDFADRAGVQINVVSRSDVAASTPEGNDALKGLADSTGGKFFLYNPAGTGNAESSGNPVLTRNLDAISDNPPSAVLAGGTVVSWQSWDSPEPLLVVAVIAVALLSVSLMVLRR